MTSAAALIEGDPLVVFSKSSCPYCDMAKSALKEVGATFKVYELDKMNNGGDLKDQLKKITNISTVPQVFLNGKYLSDGSGTKALKNSGELEKKLKEAKLL